MTLDLIKKLQGAWPLALLFRYDNFTEGHVQFLQILKTAVK